MKSIDHDIALFKLDGNVVFNEYVIPLCLPQKEENTKQAMATGWGDVGYAESASTKLLKVTLEMFEERECQAQYSREGMTRNGIDYETKMCAGSYTQRKDTCTGDSGNFFLYFISEFLIDQKCLTNSRIIFSKGGPLQIYNLEGVTCMYTIIGVTSYGQVSCGTPGSPGIYTRVFHYLDWIEGIVWA